MKQDIIDNLIQQSGRTQNERECQTPKRQIPNEETLTSPIHSPSTSKESFVTCTSSSIHGPSTSKESFVTCTSSSIHGPSTSKESFVTCTSSPIHSPSTSKENFSSLPVIHVWKEKEEDYLIELRHIKHDDFYQTKNHQELWSEIGNKLKNLGCEVTPQQAMNKYNSLKKKWKEIIDSPTGTEARYFRHKTSFDNIYGHRASTRPTSTIDTLAKESVKESESGCAIKTKAPANSGKGKAIVKKTDKRKSDALEVLNEQYRDFKEEIKSQHTEKMSRLDRLLDLYEKEIESKK